jgi:hypothetical protein
VCSRVRTKIAIPGLFFFPHVHTATPTRIIAHLLLRRFFSLSQVAIFFFFSLWLVVSFSTWVCPTLRGTQEEEKNFSHVEEKTSLSLGHRHKFQERNFFFPSSKKNFFFFALTRKKCAECPRKAMFKKPLVAFFFFLSTHTAGSRKKQSPTERFFWLYEY